MTDSFLGPERHLLSWFEEIFGPDSPQLVDLREAINASPGRISRAYQEILSGYSKSIETIAKPTVVLSGETHDGMVQAKGIAYTAVCGHHFLPFYGQVSLAYVPGKMIVGIGKLPRIVSARTGRVTIQEYIVRDICLDLMNTVGAEGAFVQATAKHLCVCARGPAKETCENVTTYKMGSLSHLWTLP